MLLLNRKAVLKMTENLLGSHSFIELETPSMSKQY